MNKDKYDEWWKACDFIEQELQFYSYNDFLENAILIRRVYINSDPLVKRLYRWYVYSSRMSYKKKCAIWEFLNMRLPFSRLSKH